MNILIFFTFFEIPFKKIKPLTVKLLVETTEKFLNVIWNLIKKHV